ncbi:hypothetical protein RUM43_011883 [Polyplax serrata]|uniref:Uncharacterized protein n=1 Tax=Polyplax serrata TaxID=468196 RepID=A0AAN8S487_POLSC
MIVLTCVTAQDNSHYYVVSGCSLHYVTTCVPHYNYEYSYPVPTNTLSINIYTYILFSTYATTNIVKFLHLFPEGWERKHFVCGSPEVASQDGSHLDSLENEEADSSNNSDMDHMEVK